MINILFPASGKADFFKDSIYPRILSEIKGKTMLQQAVDEYMWGGRNKRFIFTFLRDDCKKFHFDRIAKLITNDNCDIVKMNDVTGGGLCSCLMCVEYIDNEDELIISNFDQVMDIDYNEVLDYFRNNEADAGVISFHSIHPRWSYIRTEGDLVIESAAKKPISTTAIAGFCYFRHGHDYIEAAKRILLKGKTDELPYYASDALNDMVLQHKRVLYYPIEATSYHTFRTLEDVKKYEAEVHENKDSF